MCRSCIQRWIIKPFATVKPVFGYHLDTIEIWNQTKVWKLSSLVKMICENFLIMQPPSFSSPSQDQGGSWLTGNISTRAPYDLHQPLDICRYTAEKPSGPPGTVSNLSVRTIVPQGVGDPRWAGTSVRPACYVIYTGPIYIYCCWAVVAEIGAVWAIYIADEPFTVWPQENRLDNKVLWAFTYCSASKQLGNQRYSC